ncbi:MAG: AraC family transcriptional regulator [Spirochaetales bacterium]|nr:AraC family transcriptional regulator [Spirochaetales bacterium]
MARGKRDKIFRAFLASYVTLLAVVAGVGLMAHLGVVSLINKETRLADAALLNQSRKIIDARFDEVEAILEELSRDSLVTRLTYSENPVQGGGGLVEIRELKNLLLHYKLNNQFLDSLAFFTAESGMIISSEDIYLRKDLYYEDWDHPLEGNQWDAMLDLENPPAVLSPSEWEEALFTEPHKASYFPPFLTMGWEKNHGHLAVIQSVQIHGYGLTTSGVIVGFIDSQAVANMLSAEFHGAGGITGIWNENGDYFAGTQGGIFPPVGLDEAWKTKQQEWVHQDTTLVLTQMASQERGWIYVTASPKSEVIAKTWALWRMFIAVIGAMILAGVGMSLVLARRTSQPLRGIRELLNQHGDWAREQESPWDYPSIVQQLMKTNEGFRQQIQAHQTILKASFIEKILHGCFESETACLEAFYRLEIPSLGFPLSTLSLRVMSGEEDERHAFQLLLQSLGAEMLQNRGWIYEEGRSDLVFIIPHAWKSPQVFAQELYDFVQSQGGLEILLTIGKGAKTFFEVSQSFAQSSAALEYIRPQNLPRVLHYHDIPESGTIPYTLESEKHLIHGILAGESGDVVSIIQDIQEAGFQHQMPSLDGVIQFRHDLRSTLLEVLKRHSFPVESWNHHSIDEVLSPAIEEQFFDSVKACVQTMALHCGRSKRSHNAILRDDLISYIHKNFANHELYLGGVAVEFDLSENYLSQFFKEQTGECFTHYVERIRVQHSKALLRENWGITQIAQQCGYSSPQVFRRAFKRLEGVSPSQFRLLFIETASSV